APFKGYPDCQIPDVSDLFDCAKAAEDAGFDALWIRDVPFYDPYFGDVGQGLDPVATLGALAVSTDKIVLGSAGLILPERNPIHVAQAAVSIDQLSGHRFLLGLVSGDRRNEFKAFGRSWNDRSEIFREGWELTKTALNNPDHPHFSGQYYSKLTGSLSFVPQLDPEYPLPLVAIGRCRQELSWLANEPDAWIWHGIDEDETAPA
ncbi:LLM class flavin-dependent oxidoreductase, partial [Lactobacillus nasalidis]